MSDNPLLAAHPSRATTFGYSGDFDWKVSPTWFLLFATLAVWAWLKAPIAKDWLPLGLCISMLASGVATGGLARATRTYVYDCFMVLVVSGIAWAQARHPIQMTRLRPSKAMLLAALVGGVAMSLWRPEAFGTIQIDSGFSAQSRGEFVLWQIFGLWILAPALFLEPDAKGGRWQVGVGWIWVLVVMVVNVAGGARMQAACIGLGLIIGGVLHSKAIGRASVAVAVLAGMMVGADWAMSWFLRGFDHQDLVGVTTGRFDLWELHWHGFLREPVFGNGSYMLRGSGVEEQLGVGGEVGLIQWFSEHGAIFGGLGLFMISRGLWGAFHLARGTERKVFDVFAVIMCCAAVPALLVERFTRILGNDSFLVYWAFFYCQFRCVNWNERSGGVSEGLEEVGIGSESFRSAGRS